MKSIIFRSQALGCAVLIMVGSLACSSNAKIRKMDGSRAAGYIEGGDEENIYVRRRQHNITIPREEIQDISHPGKALMIVGGICLGVGGLSMLLGVAAKSSTTTTTTTSSGDTTTTSDDTSEAVGDTVGAFYIALGVIIAVPGVIMLITGYSKYSGSKDRMNQPVGMLPTGPVQYAYRTNRFGNESLHEGLVTYRF